MAESESGSTGRLLIANASVYAWKLSKCTKRNIRVWDFPEEVQPGQTVTARIQFAKDAGGNPGPSGEASYEIQVEGEDGENPVFKVKANRKGMSLEMPDEMRRNQGWFAVPPPPHRVANKGWSRECLVSCTVGRVVGKKARGGGSLELAAPISPSALAFNDSDRDEVFPDTPPPSADSSSRGGVAGQVGGFLGGLMNKIEDATEGVDRLLVDAGVKAPGRPSGGRGEGKWTLDWMKHYLPALRELKLSELSIPGTHDSATDSMHIPIVSPWASTQKLDLRQQLEAGVRALDLRVGHCGPDESGVDDCVAIVHDTHRTNTSLRKALETVKAYVTEHDGEIVLLDFHRFPDLGHGSRHEEAAAVVLDVLRDVMIHPKHRNLPLGKLVNQQEGRVAVLWNAREARDELFWPGIRQAWVGAETAEALHEMAAKELGQRKRAIWSLPLVLPAGVPHPVPHIPAELDCWMTSGGAWQDNANIVSVDFVEETQIVRNCIGASLLKAARAGAF